MFLLNWSFFTGVNISIVIQTNYRNANGETIFNPFCPLTFVALFTFWGEKKSEFDTDEKIMPVNLWYTCIFQWLSEYNYFKFVRDVQEPWRKSHDYYFPTHLHSLWSRMAAAWWVEDSPTSQMGSTALWPCPSEMAVLQHLPSHRSLPSRKPLNPGNSSSEATWHSMFLSALIRVALKWRIQFTEDSPLIKWGKANDMYWYSSQIRS